MGGLLSGGHNKRHDLITLDSLIAFKVEQFLSDKIVKNRQNFVISSTNFHAKSYLFIDPEQFIEFEFTKIPTPLFHPFDRVGYIKHRRKRGGYQYFWICNDCEERSRVLRYYSGALLCRKCIPARYECQRVGELDNAINMAKKISKRLIGHEFELEDLVEIIPERPNGMSARHYLKYRERYLHYARIYGARLQRALAIIYYS